MAGDHHTYTDFNLSGSHPVVGNQQNNITNVHNYHPHSASYSQALTDGPAYSEEDFRKTLQSLAFEGIYRRQKELQPALNTCDWLSEHPVFRRWLASDQEILWVKGNPGCGKLTLMRHTNEKLFMRVDQTALNLSHFFTARGNDDQKRLYGFFKSILHQILDKKHSAASGVVRSYLHKTHTLGEYLRNWSWDVDDLAKLATECLHNVLKDSNVFLLIDALDECGEIEATQLVSYLTRLFKEAHFARKLHFCFACRPYPIGHRYRGLEIKIQEENAEDLETFVNQELKELRFEQSIEDALSSSILEKARGVFQWVSLVVKRIQHRHWRGDAPAQLEKIPSQLPQDLHNLYKTLLMEAEDKIGSHCILKWICYAAEPLTLEELGYIMTLESRISISSLYDLTSHKSFSNDNDTMTRRILNLPCGLIEVTPAKGPGERQYAQVIHQSVQEFLISRSGLCCLIEGNSGEEVERAECYHQMALHCVNFLRLFVNHINVASLGSRENTLCRHAALHWYGYARRAEDHISESKVQRFVQCLGWPDVKLLNLLPHLTHNNVNWNAGDTFAHSMAFFKLKRSLRLIVESVWKMIQPCKECSLSRQLVSRDPYFARRFDGSALTPLHSAVSYPPSLLTCSTIDDVKYIIEIVLQRGLDINQCMRHIGRSTALTMAALEGQTVLMEYLLNKGANIDQEDKVWGTALGEATASNNLDCMRILLRRDASVNHKSSTDGRTPLFFCALPQATELLLMSGAMANHRDHDGRSALFAAAQYQQYEICEVLLKSGAVVNAEDRLQQTTIFQPYLKSSIIDLLVKYGADVNHRDFEQDTPLLRALQRTTITAEDIQIPLKHGANVNIADCRGQTPLTIAYKLPQRASLPEDGDYLGREGAVELLKKYGAH